MMFKLYRSLVASPRVYHVHRVLLETSFGALAAAVAAKAPLLSIISLCDILLVVINTSQPVIRLGNLASS